MIRRTGAFTLCLQLSLLLSAQVDTISNDTALLYLISDPVSIYGVVNEKPFAQSRISGDRIASLHEPIIEPLLNATPGIWMQSGTLNTNRISIRGIGYREPFATTGIRIYYDEIPLTNGAGESSIEDIHPWMLSGIEVIRGPVSAQAGAGLGGMLLLKSQLPDEDVWRTGLQGGSFGRFQLDQHLGLVHGVKDHWSTAMHYQYLKDSGFRENNDYARYSMAMSQRVRINARWDLQALVHAIALEAEIPSSLSLNDYAQHPQSAAPTWINVKANEDYRKLISGLTLTHYAKKGRISKSSVFATRFVSDEVRPFNVLEESSTAFGVRHRLAIPLSSASVFTTGMEIFHEQYDASTFETLEGGEKGSFLSAEGEFRTSAQLFANAEWMVSRRTSLHTGLSTVGMFLSGEDQSFEAPVSVFPVIAVRHDFHPVLSVSASLSRGYTALSLGDLLNSDGTLQADLETETGWSQEMSIHCKPWNEMSLSLTGYLMQVKNTIITRRIVDDQFEKYNGGETIHRGIEAEVRLVPAAWSAWTVAYTYQHHTFSAFDDGGIDYTGKRLPGVPPHRMYQTGIVHFTDALRCEVQHHWLSAVTLDDLNTQKGIPYHLLNASVSYRFTVWSKWPTECSLSVHNVFDVHYVPMYQINAPGQVPRYYYPGKPRAVYVGVKVKV